MVSVVCSEGRLEIETVGGVIIPRDGGSQGVSVCSEPNDSVAICKVPMETIGRLASWIPRLAVAFGSNHAEESNLQIHFLGPGNVAEFFLDWARHLF